MSGEQNEEAERKQAVTSLIESFMDFVERSEELVICDKEDLLMGKNDPSVWPRDAASAFMRQRPCAVKVMPTDKELEAIRKVCEYLHDEERKSWEEAEMPYSHI